MSRDQLQRVGVAQALVFGAAWLASVLGFVFASEGLPEVFVALAKGPYLGTAVGLQLALVPGYVVLAGVATLLVAPWVRAREAAEAKVVPADGAVSSAPGGLSRESGQVSSGDPRGRGEASPRSASRWREVLRVLPRVVALDAVIALLALAPALRRMPGLVDTVARKLPAFDLYALHRWHALEVGTACFALFVVVTIARAMRGQSRRVIGAVVLGVLLAGAASVRKSSNAVDVRGTRVLDSARTERPNVVVVATDSLRFDRLGVHGASRPGLSPNIDAFAQTAIDFTNLHVATASTLEAWTTLLLGQLPGAHGLRSMYPSREEVRAVEAQAGTVPKVLAAAGYETFVSSDWAGNCFDLVDFGFRRRHVGAVQNVEALLLEATLKAHPLALLYLSSVRGALGDVLVPGRSALASLTRPEGLVEQLFEDVDASVRAERPFFGVLFVSPTHLPYNARYPFNVRYGDPSYAGPHRYQIEVSAHELITTGFASAPPPETVQHVRDLYDGAVSDFDDTVGQVLRGLEARGLTENTIVIVTTDHGEDLYDPGATLGHGTNFFGGDQSTRIPLLLRVPGQGAGKVEALTRTIDVAPTLLGVLGLPVPRSMQGVDVLRDEATDRVAFAETCYLFFPKSKAMSGLTDAERAEVVELSGAADTLTVDPEFRHNLVINPAYRERVVAAKDRMVRTARWKLIEIPGKTRPIRRLYDMVADPTQQRNLAGQGLAVEEELAALLVAQDPAARHE